MIKLLISLLIVLLPVSSYATVDFLAVNHITEEYYWEEEGSIMIGWIGWEYVPEGKLNTAEESFIKLGYKRTNYTCKIESAIGLAASLFLLGLFIKTRTSKQHKHH